VAHFLDGTGDVVGQVEHECDGASLPHLRYTFAEGWHETTNSTTAGAVLRIRCPTESSDIEPPWPATK
jgi:hypothetical protein